MSIMVLMVSLMKFIMLRTHLLPMLLSLELASLSLFMLMVLSALNSEMEAFFLLYLLVMIVSEAVLGLSLMVSTSYNYGSSALSEMSLM